MSGRYFAFRVPNFDAIVNAELAGYRAIESCFGLTMADVSTEILERGRNAFFSWFEATIVGERCLVLDRNLGSIYHL